MNTKRITLLTLTALAATLNFGITDAQQVQPSGKMYRVGILVNQGAIVNGKPNPQVETLRAGMVQLGYVEGTNVIYEPRYPEGKLERLPGFAAELVAAGVDVIVAFGGPPTNAARKATSTIPIVVALVADPVAIGVAATLTQPGGNVTGVTNNDTELAPLHMALLKEMLPKFARVTILSDPNIPGADASGLAPIERANVAAARAAGLTPQVLKVSSPNPDLEGAFKTMASENSDALVVLEVPSVFTIARRVAELGTSRRVPTMVWGGQGDAGALMSYGTSFAATYPRVPIYVDRILKGAKPADTAFEVVSRRELVINLKTAHELGLTVPPELLKRADRVVE
jgi:putative tryptophan/tyrosine transport system substrate-binding protein